MVLTERVLLSLYSQLVLATERVGLTDRWLPLLGMRRIGRSRTVNIALTGTDLRGGFASYTMYFASNKISAFLHYPLLLVRLPYELSSNKKLWWCYAKEI